MSLLLHLALQVTLVSLVLASVLLISCVSLLENNTVLDSMTVLEAVSALKRQQSRANYLRVGIGSLSGKVSSVSLSSISANLAERLSTIDVVLGIGIDVLVTKMS